MLMIAAGVAGMVVAGVVAAWWLLTPGPGQGDGFPVSVRTHEAGEATRVLADQDTDSRPLSEYEVFERGGEELSAEEVTFTLVEDSVVEDCAGSVTGQHVEQALADAACTQVALGSYESSDHVAMVALFNLADTDGARAVAAALDSSADDGFLQPMDTDSALGTGYSEAELTVHGHYLVAVWAQRSDSTSPEERDNLSTALIALNKVDMAMFRRLSEHDSPEEQPAEEEPAEEQPAEEEPPEEQPAEQ